MWRVEHRARRSSRQDFTYDEATGAPAGIRHHAGYHLALTTQDGRITAMHAQGTKLRRYAYTDGNLTTVTNAAGGSLRLTYDARGRVTSWTDSNNRRYDYHYDDQDRCIAEGGQADHISLRFTYESVDPATGHRVTTVPDAAGHTTRYLVNSRLQVVARTDPLGNTTRTAYGDHDRITAVTDPLGGRPRTRPAGADRDRDGDPATPGAQTSGAATGRVLSHDHDLLGRPVRRTTPSSATTTYGYDAAGRRTALEVSGHTVAFTHDAAGRETTRRIGDGLSLSSAWDPAGRLSGQLLTAGHDTLVHRRTYAYRADGHLAAVDDHLTGARSFELDPAGRVAAVRAEGWSEPYAYDETGNQTQAAWPDAHPGSEATGARAFTGTRITSAGRIRYEHDAAGRLTSRRQRYLSRKPDTWHYTWDAEDRLTAVTTPDGTEWRYRYDPLGRRIAKQRLATDGETVAEQVAFTWDGTTLVEQTTTTPHAPHPVTLTWDHSGLHPVTQVERITDATDRREVDRHARATLWGNTTWPTSSTAYTPLRFPGQYHDPETGLHYNQNRHYDPATARYATPDPLGLTPASNPVTYVHNPHTWADPLGLSPYHDFHTVQSRADAERLRSGGEPWPAEDTRGQHPQRGRGIRRPAQQAVRGRGAARLR